jgi:hypothetical protein
MDAKNIIALVNAGYTKAEIDAMEQPADPAPETPEAPADPAPAADPQPAEAPAAQPQQDQILQALERLTNSIMQHNLNQTVVQPPEHTVQDALAAIIAPPAKNK